MNNLQRLFQAEKMIRINPLEMSLGLFRQLKLFPEIAQNRKNIRLLCPHCGKQLAVYVRVVECDTKFLYWKCYNCNEREPYQYTIGHLIALLKKWSLSKAVDYIEHFVYPLINQETMRKKKVFVPAIYDEHGKRLPLKERIEEAVAVHKAQYNTFDDTRFLTWIFSYSPQHQGRLLHKGIASANKTRTKHAKFSRWCDTM